MSLAGLRDSRADPPRGDLRQLRLDLAQGPPESPPTLLGGVSWGSKERGL